MFKKLEAVAGKYDELTRLLADPSVAADHQKYQRYSKERSDIEDVVQHYRAYRDVLQQFREAEEISPRHVLRGKRRAAVAAPAGA